MNSPLDTVSTSPSYIYSTYEVYKRPAAGSLSNGNASRRCCTTRPLFVYESHPVKTNSHAPTARTYQTWMLFCSRDIYEHRLEVPEPFLRVVKRERESPELVDWPARDRRAPFESPPRLTHYRDVPTSPRVCPKGELLSKSPPDYLQEAWVPDISAPQTVVKAVGKQLNGLTSAHEPQDQYTSPRRPSPALQSDALQ